ncbi:MAG: cytochrome c [Cyclobacteriaceae bacterium]|nr:cytochrome c [Cyclobacteriaceae bacterium]
MIKTKFHNILLIILGISLWSCKAKDEFQGLEYAPNMYHSVPYEGLSQINDESQGKWLSNREDDLGEYYNTNTNNPYYMNMREPVANTVRRSESGELPYRIHKDSAEYAGRVLINPIDSTPEILTEGKDLFEIYCTTCHGETGQGDGLVGKVFMGIPAYNLGRVKELPEGQIFHTITHGRGRMISHASQVSVDERWKITHYVRVLQNQN